MIIIIIIPLFTLGSIYSTYASGAEQMTKKKIQIKHNWVKNPKWPKANKLAIYKRGRGFELALSREEIQLALRAGLEYSGPQKCKFSALTTRPSCRSYNTTTK